jgi:hypothetical protein
MKKVIKCFVIAAELAFAASGSVWAAPAPRTMKNAVGIDFAPLVKGFVAADTDAKTGAFALGLFYERLLTSDISAGARFDFAAGKYADASNTYLAGTVFARWYPALLQHGLFLQAGLGGNFLLSGKDTIFSGITMDIQTGWRMVIPVSQKKSALGIFVEPTIGYYYAKSSGIAPWTPSGWELGLHAGVVF